MTLVCVLLGQAAAVCRVPGLGWGGGLGCGWIFVMRLEPMHCKRMPGAHNALASRGGESRRRAASQGPHFVHLPWTSQMPGADFVLSLPHF